MAIKISKKQRVALKQIDQLTSERKRQRILAIVSIALMVVLIASYNALTYQTGIIDPENVIIRGALYMSAMVIAGFSGIMFMRSSRNTRKIDGYRQSVGISRETLDAWNKGEIE